MLIKNLTCFPFLSDASSGYEKCTDNSLTKYRKSGVYII